MITGVSGIKARKLRSLKKIESYTHLLNLHKENDRELMNHTKSLKLLDKRKLLLYNIINSRLVYPSAHYRSA